MSRNGQDCGNGTSRGQRWRLRRARRALGNVFRPVAVALALLGFPIARHAQVRAPTDGARIPSIGQPTVWRWTLGAALGGTDLDGATEFTTELRAAVSRDLWNPVVGVAALQLEGFGGTRDDYLDYGIRGRLLFPFARLGIGMDRTFVEPRTRGFISLVHPIQRGGVFRDGSMLRIDVSPGAEFRMTVGIEAPIQRRLPPGRVRPSRDHVRLAAAPLPPTPAPTTRAVQEALTDARARAEWIGVTTVPWLDHPTPNQRRAEATVRQQVDALRAALSHVAPDGTTRPRVMHDEVRAFHAAVERAIAGAIATGDPGAAATLAPTVAVRIRQVLLDEVLLPYDRLLGQTKDEDTTREFARRARGILLHWLHVESDVPRDAADAVLGVFVALLDIVEENRARIAARWGDSRFVWLPLQYALLPEEHETQAQLDALIERATGERFTDGNSVSYVINEQAQYQFARMVREAREYHVLWIHDVRGTDDGGDPDEQTYRHILGAYLHAMIARVRAYDSTGVFPAYIVLLDEWFYALRNGRLWMSLLEDPLRHEVRLPRRYAAWDTALRAAQDSLRAAVAGSRLLQAQRAQYGDRWLRGLIKVHVNIINPSNWAFWSDRIARSFPVSDNMMRDHRKLAFYDLTEEDPYRGEALFTGAGIGENYSNRSWEDRSLLVRGPAALHLKEAAREVLLDQGITLDQVPWPLQPRPRAADANAHARPVVADGPHTVRAVGVHNVTGFGDKWVNVTKAVLYTLAPPGSVIKIPDSLWNSPFWGAALAGCALRGGRVLLIAPAMTNIPVPAFGSLEHSRALMWRLLAVARELAPELEARGGLLRVGLYASELEVTDIPGKVRAVQRTFAEHAWLRDLFGFAPSVYEGIARMTADLADVPMSPVAFEDFESEETPKLHLKANVIASREAWTLMTRPEWVDMAWEFLRQRIAQVQARRTAVADFDDGFPDAMLDVGEDAVEAWRASLTPAERERVVFYTLIGSHNQNLRSMVIDGEVALVVSGWPSIIPYIDLIAMIGQSVWVTTPEELETYLPRWGRFWTRLAHWFRLAF